ncbi:MAG: restriction endonuclease subunit S [Magnetococcus sp. YQC-9]
MSFSRYPDYKDSGVEWLGEVPGHWILTSLKRIFAIISGSTPKSDRESFWGGDIVWITPADLSQLDGYMITGSARTISEEGLASCGTTIIPEGCIILSTRAPIGSLGITSMSLCTNQGCKALVPNRETDCKFFYYLLSIATDELNIRGKGTTFLEISSDALAAFYIPVPSPPEQSAIAAFLDRETGKIDALVAEQEKLIALLKEKRQAVISHAVTKGLNPNAPMKDSGIEWLGEVPEHWDVVPVSYRYEVQLGKMLDTNKISGHHLRPYLRVFDVQWGQINLQDLPEMDFDEDDRIKFSLRPGDLMVNEGGSYVGRSAIWRGEIEECYYQKALHRLRAINKERDSAEFLFHIMDNATKQGVFVAGGNQATIEHLTAEALRRYRFGFPPIGEQLAIANFLESAIAKLDTLTAEAQRAIDLLKERRSALISAAVTGKIDVRGLSPKEIP